MTEDAREVANRFIREGKAEYKGKISERKFKEMIQERDVYPGKVAFRYSLNPSAGVAAVTPIDIVEGKQKPRLSEIYDLI
jgi:hypothetical protein